jgi:hypothetical protein
MQCNAKCSSFKKSDLERDFAAGVYLSEATSLRRFLSWGGRANCSWSDTECKTPAEYVSNTPQYPPSLPSHTLSVYTVI